MRITRTATNGFVIWETIQSASVRGTGRLREAKNMRSTYICLIKEQCLYCPHRDECIGKKKQKAKNFIVSASAPLFYEKSQEQKSPEFQEKYKKRAAQEWKNAEMKRFHGMTRARGWGLRSMSFQAKLTAIAVNLKRIAQLVRGNSSPFSAIPPILIAFCIILPIRPSHASIHR